MKYVKPEIIIKTIGNGGIFTDVITVSGETGGTPDDPWSKDPYTIEK